MLEIDPLFQVHILNDQGKQKATVIACKFHELLCSLRGLGLKEGRELSIVKTKLEEACFFAKKSMANESENQES
jgi:hypothetical protein